MLTTLTTMDRVIIMSWSTNPPAQAGEYDSGYL
jgi:hypothetical protein